jgi:broad specificity phosphatase PhoE
MKRMFLTFVVTGMMISAAGVVQAQEIQDRKENQQDRIANGVANGSLTPHETANLEHKEAALNRETRRDRRQNGGNLTNKEKAQVNRQQNKLSRNIYRDKHNAAHQAQ